MAIRSLTAAEDAAFERQADKEMRSHRQAPKGRNVFSWVMRFLNNKGYRDRFDDTFAGSPGSPEWFDQKFGKNK